MSRHIQIVGRGLLLLAACVVANVVLDDSDRIMVTNVLLLTAFAYSWNLVGGLLGELSFAHTIFFGVGAYAIVLAQTHSWNVMATVVLAPLLCVAIGAAVVLLGAAAKLDGLSWFVATLVLSMITAGAVTQVEALGRGTGLIIPRLPLSAPELMISATVLLAVAVTVNAFIIHSQPGRRWIAIRDDLTAAEAHGIGIVRERLVSYGVSAPIACLAGMIQAIIIGYASPSVSFGVGPLVLVILGVYIGGPGTVWGPLLGVALLEGVGVAVRRLLGNPELAEYALVTQYALAFVIVLWTFNRRRVAPATKSSDGLVDVDAVPVTPRRLAGGQSSSLVIDQVSKSFGGVQVLSDISMTLTSGTVVALVGPNGAGKTTLLNVITGQVRPSTGRVEVDGKDVTSWSIVRRSRLLRRGFQTARVFEGLSVIDNVRVGTRSSTQAATDLLRALGVAQPARSAAAIEVGDRRMVELAWAAGGSQPWLLFDEPLAGLDGDEITTVLRLIRRAAEVGAGVLVVEHRLAEIIDYLDRMVVLDLGELIADGPPQAILKDPRVIDAYFGSGTSLGVA